MRMRRGSTGPPSHPTLWPSRKADGCNPSDARANRVRVSIAEDCQSRNGSGRYPEAAAQRRRRAIRLSSASSSNNEVEQTQILIHHEARLVIGQS
jgi:hypothetical protein